MIMESLRVWQALEADIGKDVGFTEGGVLFAAATDKQVDEYAEWLKTADDFGVASRMISGDELQHNTRSPHHAVHVSIRPQSSV